MMLPRAARVRFGLASLCFALAFASCVVAQPPAPSTSYFTSLVDHFSSAPNPATFQQKILTYDGYWSGPGRGPVLFYTGNEGEIEDFYAATGIAFEWASKLSALVIFVEHRYYGSSLPFGPVNSFQQPGISYLNIAQALEDYAVIVTALQTSWGITGPNAVPWIALGGSYGGVLSAWFRSKYPNLVAGALAASAPIKYLGPQLDYSFFQAATADYAAISPTCPDAVKAGFEQLAGLVQNAQWAQIQADLQLCTEPNAESIEHVILWAVNSLLSLAQYDYPYPTAFSGAPLPGFPVTTACAMVNSPSSSSPLQALGQAVGLFYNGTGGSSGGGTLSCFDPASEFIECADQTGCGLGPDGTAWDFQVCSQFVYLPCTNGQTDMFPAHTFSLAMLTSYCEAKYQVTPDPSILNIEFGGSTILQTASNIIFSNGALDPYHAGGFTPSAEGWKESEGVEGVRVSKYFAPGSESAQAGSNSSITLLLIDLAAHHLDLRATNELDPISVTNARILELNTIIGWINDFVPPSNSAEIEDVSIVDAAPASAPVAASVAAADASQIVASSSWSHESRASADQAVSFTVALQHGDQPAILSRFQAVSDPRHAQYLQYPSEADLVAMAQPSAEVLRQVEAWVREEVCTAQRGSCSFAWTTALKDAIKVTMSAAHAEDFLGRELHVYADAASDRKIVRSSLSSMDHLLPQPLRPHVAYIKGLASFPPPIRAHGARVSDHNRVVQQEIGGQSRQTNTMRPAVSAFSAEAAQAMAAKSFASARALEASINAPQWRINTPPTQSLADSNMLQLGQVYSGDQSVTILLPLFFALDPTVVLCSFDPQNNVICGPDSVMWQGSTVVLTEADGKQSSYAIGTPERNPSSGLPEIATQFPLLRGNFAPVSIGITHNFATSSISHQWPFTPAGAPLLSPSLVKAIYNVPPSMSATQSLSTKLGIGTLVVANQPGTHSGEGNYSPRDLDLFWSQSGLPGGPNVGWVDYSNPLQSNHPEIPDGETTLDIQFGAGVMASQSCFAQIYHVSSATPFDDIIEAVLADTQPPTALSFSYGGPESGYTLAEMQYTNTRFQLLGLRRVSVIVSSGDNGAFQVQNPPNFAASCAAFGPSWPASSPFVTTVGASTLVSDGTDQCPHEEQCSVETGSLITGGGGFSQALTAQPYQLEAVNGWLQSSTCQALKPPTLAYNTSMRSYPDLVLLGHGYSIIANGVSEVMDGTSASAPSFAGMVALYNDLRTARGMPVLGFLNPALYLAARTNPRSFRNISSGSNRCMSAGQGCCTEGFRSCSGFDPVSGLGSPDLSVLASVVFGVDNNGLDVPVMLSQCTSSSDGVSKVVLIVACICVLLIIAAFVFWCIRRRRRAASIKQMRTVGYMGASQPMTAVMLSPEPEGIPSPNYRNPNNWNDGGASYRIMADA